jgi:hypothetical protein
MKDITELDRLTKATRRREFDDGLVDFVFGLLFLTLGLFCWFILSTNGMRWYLTAFIWNRGIALISSLLALGLLILLLAGSRALVEKFRRDYLWRDLGFVKSLNIQVRWQVQLIATVVAISMILIGFWLALRGVISQETALELLIASAGVATGIVFLGMGIELKVVRYHVVGWVGILCSILPLFFSLSFSVSWLVFGVTWMVILALSGSWGLYKFVLSRRVGDHE